MPKRGIAARLDERLRVGPLLGDCLLHCVGGVPVSEDNPRPLFERFDRRVMWFGAELNERGIRRAITEDDRLRCL